MKRGFIFAASGKKEFRNDKDVKQDCALDIKGVKLRYFGNA